MGLSTSHSIISSGVADADAMTPVKSTTSVTGANLSGMSGFNNGYMNECFIVSGGVLCSGDNEEGQLGNGTTTSGSLVQPTGLGSGVTQIASGDGFNCALKSDGSVWCWGYNASGQIGNGTTTNQTTPYEVISSGATYIAASELNACAVVANDLKCWGDNSYGQLNATTGVTCINSDPCSKTPIAVTGMTTNVTKVAIFGRRRGLRHSKWCG